MKSDIAMAVGGISNQIEYVMSYSIYKHKVTLKMAFEELLGGVNFLVDPLAELAKIGEETRFLQSLKKVGADMCH
jgi:hypothetical protein